MNAGESACPCDSCSQLREWRQALNPQTPEAIEAFNEMIQDLENAQTDAAWAEQILCGKWPNSVEILESALAIARRLAEQDRIH